MANPTAEPVRQSWSLDELRVNARRYMELMYGKPGTAIDKDAWYVRFGMLVDFAEVMWHEIPSPLDVTSPQEAK